MKVLKAALFSLLFVGGFALTSTQAQVDATISPIGVLFGNITIGADFAINENVSIEPSVGFKGGDKSTFKYRNIPVSATGKYYFNPKHGTDRFYASSWLRYINRTADWDGDTEAGSDYTQHRLGLGFGLGYKVVSDGGFVFDIGGGIGRALLDEVSYQNNDTATDVINWPDLMTNFKLGIGYRF